MAQQSESPMTFPANEDLLLYRRVKFTAASRNVEYADAGDWFVGITQESAVQGRPISVKDKKDGGTKICTAAAAIALGADIYGANDGKVSTSVSGVIIGKALQVAGADGDQIECFLDTSIGEGWS